MITTTLAVMRVNHVPKSLSRQDYFSGLLVQRPGRREHYGHSAERTARLIDQLELQLKAQVTDAAEYAAQAEKTTEVAAFERKKPVRKLFPEQQPRERVVVRAPIACS